MLFILPFYIQLLRELARLSKIPDLKKDFESVWRDRMEKIAMFAKMQSSVEAQNFAKYLDETPLEEIPGMSAFCEASTAFTNMSVHTKIQVTNAIQTQCMQHAW